MERNFFKTEEGKKKNTYPRRKKRKISLLPCNTSPNNIGDNQTGTTQASALPLLEVPVAAAARDKICCDNNPEFKQIARYYNRNNGVGCDDEGNALHVATTVDNNKPNSNNGMSILGASLETQLDKMCKVIKKVPGGAFEHNICHKCKKIPSNHYCTFIKKGSGISVEGMSHQEICGTLECNMCKGEWCDSPEDYNNCCIHHQDK